MSPANLLAGLFRTRILGNAAHCFGHAGVESLGPILLGQAQVEQVERVEAIGPRVLPREFVFAAVARLFGEFDAVVVVHDAAELFVG